MNNQGNLIRSFSLDQYESLAWWWKLTTMLFIITVFFILGISSWQLWNLISVRRSIASITHDVNYHKTLQAAVEQEKMNIKKITQLMSDLMVIKNAAHTTVAFVDSIAACLPSSVKLTNYNYANRGIVLQGISKTLPMMMDFVHRLRNNSELKNVQLAGMKPHERAFQFSITISTS